MEFLCWDIAIKAFWSTNNLFLSFLLKISAISETAFHYKDKIRPVDYVVHVAMNMQVIIMIYGACAFIGYFLRYNWLIILNA